MPPTLCITATERQELLALHEHLSTALHDLEAAAQCAAGEPRFRDAITRARASLADLEGRLADQCCLAWAEGQVTCVQVAVRPRVPVAVPSP